MQMKRRFSGEEVANMMNEIMTRAGIDKTLRLTSGNLQTILFSMAESCYLMGRTEALQVPKTSKSN